MNVSYLPEFRNIDRNIQQESFSRDTIESLLESSSAPRSGVLL